MTDGINTFHEMVNPAISGFEAQNVFDGAQQVLIHPALGNVAAGPLLQRFRSDVFIAPRGDDDGRNFGVFLPDPVDQMQAAHVDQGEFRQDGVNLTREIHDLSYKDGDGYHFIHPETFEDVLVGEDLLGDVKKYLIEGQSYNLLFCDDVIASVELPPSMVMTVTESPDGVKGDSANNVYKAAVMETGLVVQVPLFIGPGEKINVKTEDGSYLSRA
jgi:hypothetical protein